MTVLSHKFGPTTIAKLSNPHELSQLLVDPLLKSETVIIKPNFAASAPGIATTPEALRALLESLDSHIIVTESHMICRSPKYVQVTEWENMPPIDELCITVKGKKRNWIWLMQSEGWRWQTRSPDWSWFIENGQWDQIRKEDKEFLDSNGYTDIFNEFGVEYINVTDEVWSGRTADSAEVKLAVESRYKPVFTEKLYSLVPKRFYDLRGSTLISYAKLEAYNSFTLKNLFGMIPDPVRAWWHGVNDSRLTSSIIDINKIYQTLFNVYGICEALHINPVPNPEGEWSLWGTPYNIVEDLGLVGFGRDLVSLDAIKCNLVGFEMNWKNHISKAEHEFGSYDREIITESKAKVGDWLLK